MVSYAGERGGAMISYWNEMVSEWCPPLSFFFAECRDDRLTRGRRGRNDFDWCFPFLYLRAVLLSWEFVLSCGLDSDTKKNLRCFCFCIYSTYKLKVNLYWPQFDYQIGPKGSGGQTRHNFALLSHRRSHREGTGKLHKEIFNGGRYRRIYQPTQNVEKGE